MSGPLTIGIVAGEESGQLLARDVLDALAAQTGRDIRLVGVGGEGLSAYGLKSVFDPSEIAITGLSAVVTALPRLIMRIGQTADAIIAAKPECLLLIDSPDFSLRVARKVRKQIPDLPIIKYVAPTVWAWRPGRAAKMAAHVDHVLAILPFEPRVMEELGGPKTTYVGHRLASDTGLAETASLQAKRRPQGDEINLVVLPGSRRGEVRSLMAPFGETLAILVERGGSLDVTIPTLERLKPEVERLSANWPVRPRIVTGREAQLEAFAKADCALCASGTVTLELALAGVPAISCYVVDGLMRLFTSMITAWSAALPNIIADRAIIREYYNEQIRPGMLARLVEELAQPDSAMRAAVLDGYEDVRERMATDEPAGLVAARTIAELLKR